MGGEDLPYADAREAVNVTLAERPDRRYPVDGIWLEHELGRWKKLVGVVVVERDTRIARWRELHRAAYVTDGGLGGITTAEWAARPQSEKALYEKRLIEWFADWRDFDVDGHEGVDTIAFQNGYGDGGFPSSAGYDAAGRRVEIVLWTTVAPWRLAFPEGTPPAQVRQREKHLAECLAGRRKMELGLRCRVAR